MKNLTDKQKDLIFEALMQAKILAEDTLEVEKRWPDQSPFDKGVPSKMVKLANDALRLYESLFQ
jgi:hypothetical protein